jgi:hypothetical protein
LRYTVASELPPLASTPPTPEQITATAGPVPEEWRKYTRLPKTSDITEIEAQARKIVTDAGATTPYAQAQALRDFFRDDSQGFVYDTTVGFDDSGSAILQFLRSKHGYCVQFASAYTVMARALGIPARVAVGFTPGTQTADGTYHVTSHDAHAWPEIYLSGLGWTHLFDPTPSSRDTPTGGSNLPGDTAANLAPSTTLPTATTVPTAPGTGSSPSPGGPAAPTTAPVTLAPAPTASSSSLGAWLPVLVVLGLLVLAVGGYVIAVLALKRRRRSRRHAAADPVVAVTGAWEEALDRLHEAAVVPRAAQTPLDLAATVPAGTTAAAALPMHALASAYGAARYGDGAVAPDDVVGAWNSLDALERALDDGVSWSQRWRRRLDPSTLALRRR